MGISPLICWHLFTKWEHKGSTTTSTKWFPALRLLSIQSHLPCSRCSYKVVCILLPRTLPPLSCQSRTRGGLGTRLMCMYVTVLAPVAVYFNTRGQEWVWLGMWLAPGLYEYVTWSFMAFMCCVNVTFITWCIQILCSRCLLMVDICWGGGGGEPCALSFPNEYAAGKNYKWITNSSYALLCMSGYVYSCVASLRMSEEQLLVPRDVLFDSVEVTTSMSSCTILWKANLLQCFIYEFVQGGQNYSMAKWRGDLSCMIIFQGEARTQNETLWKV